MRLFFLYPPHDIDVTRIISKVPGLGHVARCECEEERTLYLVSFTVEA
jgi:hypothetical protein